MSIMLLVRTRVVIHLHSINQMVLVVGKRNISCEVGSGHVSNIQMSDVFNNWRFNY